ncbi:ABC transporter permease [Kineosporia succinea]|uniref:Ribose transport system permease protein n=1 Tax=Kineosporia succinea TaxID=84632 RepID=A0ABT9PDB7_9ACTN|nr:ABC transporter permease [Kineosporia succinea]MDP9830477.1 ribose transport system permease protein [Kineosporia succinea]
MNSTNADSAVAETAPADAAATGSRWAVSGSLVTRFNLLLIFIALCIAASVLSPVFLTSQNISNLLQQSSVVGITAIGMTFVILVAGIDLSVGSVAALAGMSVALLIEGGVPWYLAIVISLSIGAVLGSVMGGLSAYLTLPAFMVTLAGLQSVRGLTYLTTDGTPTDGNLPEAFTWLGTGKIGPLPVTGLIFIAITIIAAVVLRRTVYGEYIYATGSNPTAARLSGVPTKLITLSVFAISGVLASLAGVLLTARLTIGQPTAASGLELDAIAAVVLGGTSLFGGKGGVSGTFLAVLLLAVLRNLFNLLGLGSYFQMVVTGLVLVVALVLNYLLERRSRA